MIQALTIKPMKKTGEQYMYKVAFAVIVVTSMTGCASSTATTEKLPIKVIPSHVAEKCEFIQQIAINKTSAFNSVNAKVQQAQQDLAQQSISLGGNAMVIEDTDITGNGHVVDVTASVYKCKQQQ